LCGYRRGYAIGPYLKENFLRQRRIQKIGSERKPEAKHAL
jgi:hypothetical protein